MLRGNETKPGLFTTEFWLAGVLPWIVVALQNGDVIKVVPDRYRFVLVGVTIIANGFYALSRGRAKQGVPYQPPA